MERLTEKHEADAQCKEYKRRLANGYPRNIPEERFLRLAAYEDTGLTPEDIAKAKDALEYAYGNADRIIELAHADKDGRVAILPCKADGAQKD